MAALGQNGAGNGQKRPADAGAGSHRFEFISAVADLHALAAGFEPGEREIGLTAAAPQLEGA